MIDTMNKRICFEIALQNLLNEEYQRGLNEGLWVADKIAGYLTKQPQPQWMKQIHEWAIKEITKKREKNALIQSDRNQPIY